MIQCLTVSTNNNHNVLSVLLAYAAVSASWVRKITPKSPRGVCGADADLIVARNMTRAAAGGLTQHGAHAREILISLKAAANDQLDIPILGEKKFAQYVKLSTSLKKAVP